ncbi:MAG: hypothetical protein DMG21_00880 [Acidobacteria bacterium]|nr:MAG: hypothetical protein DMG21_00880 [Acidobacteriota bacterium]
MKTFYNFALWIALAALGTGVAAAQQTSQNLSSPSPTAAWSQYGFQAAHLSFNSTENLLTPANVSSLEWKAAAEVGAPIASAPVVRQGIVYVAAGGTIFAYQTSDGTPLWSHASCSGVNTVQAALGAQALLVGDGGGDLAAYDPVTGAQIWCRDEGGSITAAPTVNGNVVYITNGASVVAVDQLTGTQQWRFTPSDFSPVTNTPAVLKNIVYVSGGGSVFALNGKSGRQIWRTNLQTCCNISAPTVAGNTVYVGGQNLYALRASNGSLLWTQTVIGTNVSMPAIAYGKVFVNSQDAQFGLFAFDASSGSLLWRTIVTEESLATVTVANGVIYDISDTSGPYAGVLVMIDPDTGTVLGSVADPDGTPFNSLFRSQPAVVNGTLYVPTGSDPSLGVPNRVDIFRLP